MAVARATSLARLLAVLAALAVTVVAAGCGSSGDGSNTSATDVKVADFSFAPSETTVRAGQTVTWTNEGQADHTVKGQGFFSAKALGTGEKFSHRFTKPGRFPYLCTLHPTQMRGTVVVRR
jgi:plastocyanin